MTDLEKAMMVYGGIMYSKRVCENKKTIGVKGLQSTINTLEIQLGQIRNVLDKYSPDKILATCQKDVYSLL